DGAYREKEGLAPDSPVRRIGAWLALTPARSGPGGGCLRFAPGFGFDIKPHMTLEPGSGGSSGFRTRMVEAAAAQAETHAEDVPVESGDVILIGDTVAHASHQGDGGEGGMRVAFSALYEVMVEKME
ncbi:unnamed protein product, partial [Polarella glacialis]